MRRVAIEANSNTILIIGGTTEGRIALRVCDDAGKPFFYSTKNASQQVECVYGRHIYGGLDEASMIDFCRENNIALIVDSAHPFAENVHKNIGLTAKTLSIPVIRLERKLPAHNPLLHWFDSYKEAICFLEEKKIDNLLALTGVNTISKLKPYWERHSCTFRIMNRDESLEVIAKSGFPRERIIFYDEGQDEKALFIAIAPQAIITKESGEVGGFSKKTDTALSLSIPVLVIRRPLLPYTATTTVYGEYGLRKQIETLLPDFFDLKTGYTTGSCATAASKAALIALFKGESERRMDISLPNDELIEIDISNTIFEKDGSVTCSVIKDSGDDPDVTNGLEICSNVRFSDNHNEIRFLQGCGVGRVTLPGLGLEIGSPAINATPRSMIENELSRIIEKLSDDTPKGIDVTISVPRGEEIAKKTFNQRLGIIGGISIIGTSGIVKPFSSEAFVGSIRREAQVAKALEVDRLIINSGAKSERQLKAIYPDAIPQAFVQYGNFIGETLHIAEEEGFGLVTLGVMIGKAVKLAEGLLDTHSKKAVMNRDFIRQIAIEAKCSERTVAEIGKMTLARELWEIIPKREIAFFYTIIDYCQKVCSPLLPSGKITILLIDEDGNMLSAEG